MNRLILLFLLLATLCFITLAGALWLSKPQLPIGSGRVAVVFTGGHETDPVDKGRPVVLIAGALGVKPEVFREAFSAVRPAQGMFGPSGERARENKEALMRVLAPLGVTNERLDEVSNYYRYRPGSGDLWPTEQAAAYAIVDKGVVTTFEITDGGSGYSSLPSATVPGYGPLQVELSYGQAFKKNGAVVSLSLR